MDKLYSLVEEHMLTRHEHLYSIPNTQKKKNSHLETEFSGIYALSIMFPLIGRSIFQWVSNF